jgi:subtilisin family serine protease
MFVKPGPGVGAVAVACLASGYVVAQPQTLTRKSGDLHTAIALTQAHLYGATGVTARAGGAGPSADVLSMIAPSNFERVLAKAATHGMNIRFEDARSGYLRVTVPLDKVRLLFEWPEVDAVRVDGLAGYDTRLQSQTLSALGFSPSPESPTEGAAVASPTVVPRPPLTREIARQYPINTDQDMGVTEFRAAHPTFDGRGVTIGILESTWIPLDHPAYESALALDGSPRRKVLRHLDYPSIRREGFSAPLSNWFDCRSVVCEAEGRLFRLPAAGRYRTADLTLLGRDLEARRAGMARYAALQRESTGSWYVDTNGDLDFSNERALTDFNAIDWDRRSIVSLRYPGGPPVSAVVSLDAARTFLWLHPFDDGHGTGTSSVAAGSDVPANLAVGIAPNASLVFSDGGPRSRLESHLLEGVIGLARDPDVDVLSLSVVKQTPLGTRESFDAVALDRISEAYNKPILLSAGNYVVPLSASPAPGGRVAMTVGQYVSPRTTEALFGVRRPEAPVIASTVGPALDGSSRPDFVAASRRPAAAPCAPSPFGTGQTQFLLPPCYKISGGTSGAAPSAAGAVALLISAAKQRGLKPSVAVLREAIFASAALVPGIPPHMQGVGLINVPRAWRYLEQGMATFPLDVEGELRHRFVDFIDHARARGLYLVARSGGAQTMTATLRASSGSERQRVTIRSDGPLAIAVPNAVSVDSAAAARVPVTITPPAVGRIASSWLTFRTARDRSVMRLLTTAARPAPLQPPSYEYAWRDDVDFETHSDRLVAVPAGATGMLIEADLIRGDGVPILANPWSLPLLPSAYWSGGRFFSTPVSSPPGTYAGVLLDPDEGDWGVSTLERSTIVSWIWAASTTLPERFSIGMRMTAFRTDCQLASDVSAGADRHIRLSVKDVFAKPVDGGLVAAPAALETHNFTLRDEFERRAVSIDVKPGTAAFLVQAHRDDGNPIVLQLFDCTFGHCLSQLQSSPGEISPALSVRQPRAGEWKVFAVSVRPFDRPVHVEVAVAQIQGSDIRALERATDSSQKSNASTMFEGRIPSRAGSSGLVAFRTDRRAAMSKEGWGAVSACVMQQPAQPVRDRERSPRRLLVQ